MNTEHLAYFISLSQTLNFSETARQLDVPQPTISRSILELEHQLNAQLFLRNKRSVTLTREGEAFLPFAEDALGILNRAEFALERIQQGASGMISIAALSTSASVVTRCVAAFSKRYPNIIVDIQYNTGSEQQKAISQKRFDFYFGVDHMIPEDQGFDTHFTHQDCLVLVVPEDHGLTTENFEPYRLSSERLIALSEAENPSLYATIVDMFAREHVTPHVVQRYNKAESILLSVAAGLGVSILPKNLAETLHMKGIRLVELPDSPVGTYRMAWHHESANPVARLFLDVALQVLAEDAPDLSGEHERKKG
jgi:DNA-binding transcriptional LysR family regulator